MTYEHFPFPLWVLNQQFEVLDLNQAAKNFSTVPFSGVSEEDKSRLQDLKFEKKDKKLCLKWISNKDILWLEWRLWKEGENIYLCADDVTTSKNNELYYQQILDAIPDMILVKSKGSHIHWANKAFQDHYKMSNKELQEIIDAPFQAADLTQQYVKEDKWVWDNKKKLMIDCETVLTHDGVPRKFQTLKAPILDQDEHIQFTVGVSRDITEKIEYEQKSYTASKMASLGEMAGGIAHEINNPIGIILAKSYQLKRKIQDQKIKEDIEVIERNSLRVAKIVEGLRNFCQEGDKQISNLFNVREVLDETITYCQFRLSNEGVKLDINIPEGTKFFGKKVQLSQILLNLINNALDAVSGQHSPWIKISSTQKYNHIELRIEDSGPGVPEELESKIMQPFFTTKEVGKGTGLGLSISFSLAKLQNGSLSLDRKTSPSCFLLILPSALNEEIRFYDFFIKSLILKMLTKKNMFNDNMVFKHKTSDLIFDQNKTNILRPESFPIGFSLNKRIHHFKL